MTTDTRYNGWANYQTWAVNLWLSNDGSDWLEENARECLEESECDKDDARRVLADRLEELHDEWLADNFPSLASGASVFTDLMHHALGSVDWQEIAESALADFEVWVAGYNAPGCLPDNTPARFLSQEEARAYARECLEEHADDFDAGAHDTDDAQVKEDYCARADKLRVAACATDQEAGEFSYPIAGNVYFVARA